MDTARSERAAIVATQLVEHAPFLLRVARSRVRDDHLAEEAVQDALLAALESAHSFKGRAKLRTWLTGILLHKIHDAFRRAAREPVLPADEHDALDTVDDDTPDRALHGKQTREALLRSLALLPPRQAHAFVMWEVSGADAQQIGRALGVSVNNVWVLLHRARAGLRAALEHEGFSPS